MSTTKCSFHPNLNLWDFLHWEKLQNLGWVVFKWESEVSLVTLEIMTWV